MGVTDYRRFRNFRVEYQRAFNLCSTQSVPGDIDNVIDATSYPVVAISIPLGAVTGQVVARIGRKIGCNTTLMIAIDRANLTRPTL